MSINDELTHRLSWINLDLIIVILAALCFNLGLIWQATSGKVTKGGTQNAIHKLYRIGTFRRAADGSSLQRARGQLLSFRWQL